MFEVKLSYLQAQRLMNSILWVLAPYMDDNTIKDHPWLVELAENFNQLYNLFPSEENFYQPIIYETLS